MPAYPSALDDRYAGVLLGLACGDALGATTSFCERGSFVPLRDMIGGGVYGLRPGQWTDDTSMAMCLAESLVACDGFDPLDQMRRYLRWYRHGEWSAKPFAFDIGQTTEHSLQRFEKADTPWCGPTHPITAGNGSLMRLGPVVLHYHPDVDAAVHFAGESSRTTHGAALAVEGCRLLAQVLSNLLRGLPKERCLEGAASRVQAPRLRRMAEGAYQRKPPSRIHSSGYVVHTLEAALWCLHRSASMEEALLRAANLGDDADTVAAVTGQLAGAHFGASRIPRHWLQRLHRRDEIETLALCLRRL